VATGASARLLIRARVIEDIPALVCGYAIRNRFGQDMYGTNTHHFNQVLGPQPAGACLEFSFTFPVNLGEGEYSVAAALTGGETHLHQNYEWRDLAAVFTVVNTQQRPFTGGAWMEPSNVEVRHGDPALA
jgi:lipopolysaccharide transport system ATP-binding protein